MIFGSCSFVMSYLTEVCLGSQPEIFLQERQASMTPRIYRLCRSCGMSWILSWCCCLAGPFVADFVSGRGQARGQTSHIRATAITYHNMHYNELGISGTHGSYGVGFLGTLGSSDCIHRQAESLSRVGWLPIRVISANCCLHARCNDHVNPDSRF